MEVMSALYTYDVYDSADLDGISIGGVPLAGFAPGKTEYTVNEVIKGAVTATSSKNAAITVLPLHKGAVTILTSSEDGKTSRKYKIQGKVENSGGDVINPPAPDGDNTPKPPVEDPVLKKGDTVKKGNVQYKVLNASKKTVTAVKITNKKATKITIPATLKVNGIECKVTEISQKAFKGANKLKSVVIGKNVTTIGKNAFLNCKKLEKVEFKGTAVKTIKDKAFKGTSKKVTVKVPKGMKKTKKNSIKTKLKKAGMNKNLKIK